MGEHKVVTRSQVSSVGSESTMFDLRINSLLPYAASILACAVIIKPTGQCNAGSAGGFPLL